MENNFDIVKSKITANLIIEWCKEKNKNALIFFNNSLVYSDRKFRFTTNVIEQIFPSKKDKTSYWNNGVFILYEIENNKGDISLSLLVSSKGILNKNKLNSFLHSNLVEYNEDVVVVKKWNIFSSNNMLLGFVSL